MKKLCVMSFVAVLFLCGCQNQTALQTMQKTTRLAIVYGQSVERQELAKCADANDCPEAEKIAQWVARGELLYAVFSGENPQGHCDAIDAGFKIVLDEMIASGETESNIMLVQILEGMIKVELCGEKP